VDGVDACQVSFEGRKAEVWGTAQVRDLISAVQAVGFDAQLRSSLCAPVQQKSPPHTPLEATVELEKMSVDKAQTEEAPDMVLIVQGMTWYVLSFCDVTEV
jgi:hypothetical protein